MQKPNRLPLAQLPTPIQFLQKTSAKIGKKIHVWRDDLTGFLESGNKVRKLEFLLADALNQGCDWIVTCGGPQSNHTRATSVLARRFGLGVSVLISPPKPGFDPNQPATGNLLLNRIFGSQLLWIDAEEYEKSGRRYDPFLEREMERQRALGRKPYAIPSGGSSTMGCWGYRSAISEMLETWRKNSVNPSAPDSIFCAFGSGGTYVGLQLGLEDHGLRNTQLRAINVLDTASAAEKYLSPLTESASRYFSIDLSSREIRARHQLLEGYAGAGYSLASDKDLELYTRLARDEGILLDPCYTGKAFQGMLAELEKDPSQYGENILFLHSGGGFGTFAYSWPSIFP